MAFRNSTSAVPCSREAATSDAATRSRPLLPRHRWLLLALVACLSTGRAADFDGIRALAMAGSVLKVEAIGDAGFMLGTAVSVAPGLFVTNCHVTRNATVVVLMRGGARWPVESERADLYLDLCLLRVPDLAGVPAVPLAAAGDVRVKQPVAAAGYTGGMGLQMHGGVVIALHAFRGGKVIQTTTAFTSGASGGALFDARGRLAGILTFRLRGASGYYFAAPVDWIAARLDDDSGYVAIAPLTGDAPFWAQPPTALPFFMQAASFEHDGRWGDLLELTDRWTREAHDDPESWFMRGSSLVHQGHADRAVVAYRSAVDLDPRYTRAWLALGNAYAAIGAADDAERVVAILRDLDGEAADELAARLMARPASPQPQTAVPTR